MSALLVVGATACEERGDASAPTADETKPASFAAKRAAPRVKETRAANDEKLGTLPEGVGLPVGTCIPDVFVTDAEGASVKLSELLPKGPLLVVFYRGGWCPFCNFQLRELATRYAELESSGVLPVAISVDRMNEATKTRATYSIPFSVLSDPRALRSVVVAVAALESLPT